MKKRIYLSGPITGLPLEVAKQRFEKASQKLRGEGHNVINPLEAVPEQMEYTKDLRADDWSGEIHEYFIADNIDDWSHCMRVALCIMLDCHEICMLPDWQNSAGAQLEREIALRLGIPVQYIYNF